MDQSTEIYSDEYMSQSMLNSGPSFPSMGGIKNTPIQRTGRYEDVLRYDQMGVPINMTCNNPNPYLDDHKPNPDRRIRLDSIDQRAWPKCNDRHNPSVEACDCRMKNINNLQGGNSPNGNNNNGQLNVDPMILLHIFIFVVLVYICTCFWKSIHEVKQTLGQLRSNNTVLVVPPQQAVSVPAPLPAASTQ